MRRSGFFEASKPACSARSRGSKKSTAKATRAIAAARATACARSARSTRVRTDHARTIGTAAATLTRARTTAAPFGRARRWGDWSGDGARRGRGRGRERGHGGAVAGPACDREKGPSERTEDPLHRVELHGAERRRERCPYGDARGEKNPNAENAGESRRGEDERCAGDEGDESHERPMRAPSGEKRCDTGQPTVTPHA